MKLGRLWMIFQLKCQKQSNNTAKKNKFYNNFQL